MSTPGQPDPAPNMPDRAAVLPDVPVLVTGAREAVLVTPAGEVDTMSLAAAGRKVASEPALFCYATAVRRKLGIKRAVGYDALELFAFTRPANFILPTPLGLAHAMDLADHRDHGLAPEDTALLIVRSAHRLLEDLTRLDGHARSQAARIATTMTRAGWVWGPAVLTALGAPEPEAQERSAYLAGYDVWNRLTEWDEEPPAPPPGDLSVTALEAGERLGQLVGSQAERREAQIHYAEEAAKAFAPRDRAGVPNVVLAEAGTGVGKTLGYIAPASVWAEKNQGTVWLSTYTKNLQRQIDQELDKLYDRRELKAKNVVIRKGRENYLCLLNLEEEVGRGGLQPDRAIGIGLVARWAGASRDGDMVGGDFPSWLLGSLGGLHLMDVTDRRGECIYSACPHYRKCFIERAVRKSRSAEIVIANHALVMINAALRAEEGEVPTRYVFDEGHHLFDAADNAFSAHLSGYEAAELRRWIRGAESGRGRSANRVRGLEKRVGDLVGEEDALETALHDAVAAAAALPGEGWHNRIASGAPMGPAERFLAASRQHVLARADKDRDGYSLEASADELPAMLLSASGALRAGLMEIAKPLQVLAKGLTQKLDKQAATMESATRARIEGVVRGLSYRADNMLQAWIGMLGGLGEGTPEKMVDWFSIERIDGRELDVGLHRHWIDPTEPFAETVLDQAHGAIVTSATLRDQVGGDDAADDDWRSAEMRTGALHLAKPPERFSLASPFDYAAKTRVFVVTDVKRTESDQVAAAYRELFRASHGGGLGLFTAVSRLKAVYGKIAAPLEEDGISLYAQHIDPMDTGTLVDIFRAERDSCLLGTDAVRDGVDVPGHALRLIVFDRIPWPRPTILHRARRNAFGARGYDDMLTRLRLKQAFGRLVRSRNDYGVFVMLDSMAPSRLMNAFPPGVSVERLGLKDVIERTRDFLQGWREGP